MMFTFVACSSSNNSDSKDDDDDKKTVEKADEKDENEEDVEDIVDEESDEEYVDVDNDYLEAEDALYEYLDVMYDPTSEEFAEWVTEGEDVESFDGDYILAASVVAYMLMDRDYMVLSGEYVDEGNYDFEVAFDIADFYDAAEIFEEEIMSYDEADLEALAEEDVISIMLECIAAADSATYELAVIMEYDENDGWVVTNEEQIITLLVEDFASAFDF